MSSSSSRRQRRRPPLSRAPGAAAPAEQRVVAADDELLSRLRALLPRDQAAAAGAGAGNGKAKASSSSWARVLREACAYIRRLHVEIDAAAEQLARLLEDADPSVAALVVGDGTGDAADDELIRNLLL